MNVKRETDGESLCGTCNHSEESAHYKYKRGDSLY